MRIIRPFLAIASAALFMSLAFLPVQASESFDLILPEEAAEALANPAPESAFQSKVLGAPIINVLSPTVDAGVLASPVDIEMSFESPDNTEIDMQSLRIFYVMLIKKDVTDRILQHATLEGSSLIAKDAKLPKGKHKFIVEIQDANKRKTREQFSVRVSS